MCNFYDGRGLGLGPNKRCHNYWVKVDVLIFLTVHFTAVIADNSVSIIGEKERDSFTDEPSIETI